MSSRASHWDAGEGGVAYQRFAAAAPLGEGERIEAVFTGRAYPSFASRLALGMLFAPLMELLARPYYVGVTDRRLFLYTASASGQVGTLVYAEPLAGVELTEVRRGPRRDRLALHRTADGSTLILDVIHMFRGPVARTLELVGGAASPARGSA
jgi:hypothetical protein